MLMRGIFPKSVAAHRGEWVKSAANSWEVRGKTLGIVGYGNIGAQLSVLAEALGMHVIFYDTTPSCRSAAPSRAPRLDELLARADVVSLHVPDTRATRRMIGEAQIRAMRPGSFLINASRGKVVDVEALAAAIRDGHLLGAAVDVFPDEPAGAARGVPLAAARPAERHPHAAHRRLDRGGAGPDRQRGGAQARRLLGHRLDLRRRELPPGPAARPALGHALHARPPQHAGHARARSSTSSSAAGLNIGAQYLQTDGELGYVVIDVDGGAEEAQEILADLRAIPGTIRARFLYERPSGLAKGAAAG